MSVLECYNSSAATYLFGWKIAYLAQRGVRSESLLVKDDDFFSEMWKTNPWAAIWSEIEYSVKVKEEAFEHFYFIVSKRKIPFMANGVEAWKFRLRFLVAVESSNSVTKLLKDNQAEIVKFAKEALAKERMADELPESEEDIADMSGSDFTRAKFNKLEDAFKHHFKRMPSGRQCEWLWQLWDFDIIKAVYNLACAHSQATQEIMTKDLFFDPNIETVWSIFQTILAHPGAVEKEYVRSKTRHLRVQNSGNVCPKSEKIYSLCCLLRLERSKRLRMMRSSGRTSAENLLLYVEQERLMDAILNINEAEIFRVAENLRKEEIHRRNPHYRQAPSLDITNRWIDDNHQTVLAEALAHNAAQTLPVIAETINEIESYCVGADYKWTSEAPTFSEIRTLLPAAKQECLKYLAVTFTVCSDPAPAA